MVFVSRRPGDPLLADVVDTIWYTERRDTGDGEAVLPTGKAQLLIGLDPSAPTAFVQGPTTRRRIIETDMLVRTCGVALKAGGLGRLTSVPVNLLTDEFVGFDDALGVEAEPMLDEWVGADGHDRVIDGVECFLRSVLSTGDERIDPAVESAVQLLGTGAPVLDVAALVGMDRRRLATRFRSKVGVGPKTMARVRRFERAVAAVRNADAPGLAVVAAELGYADQAHMTRDFREFGDTTPSALHRDGSRSPNHVDL